MSRYQFPSAGTATTDASLLVSGTLADARLSSNVALENVANVFSAKQSFSGTDHVGLCLQSLTTAEYNALTPANGDLFRDSTTDRIDARLARGTVELIDSAGGQEILGALTTSSTLSSRGNIRGASVWVGGASFNNVKFYGTASGLFSIYNSAETAGVMINVTGNSAVFRNLANNADAPITCSNLTASGTLTYSSIAFPELVTNGGFDTDTAWSKGAGWTISGGTAVATGVVSFADINQNLPGVDLGKTYIVRVTMTKSAGTGLQIYIGTSGSSFALVGQINITGTYSFLFHKNDYDAAKTLLFRGASDFTGTIDNVSVKRAF